MYRCSHEDSETYTEFRESEVDVDGPEDVACKHVRIRLGEGEHMPDGEIQTVDVIKVTGTIVQRWKFDVSLKLELNAKEVYIEP